MARCRSLPVSEWPAADQFVWLAACRPSERFGRGGPARHLRASTKVSLQRGYGYLLDFCERKGMLDPAAPPPETKE